MRVERGLRGRQQCGAAFPPDGGPGEENQIHAGGVLTSFTLARLRGIWYRIKYQYLLRNAVMKGTLYAHARLEIKGPGKVVFEEDVRIMSTAFGQEHVSIYLNRRESRTYIGKNVILRGTRVGCETVVDIREGSVIEAASLFDTDFHNIDASKRDEKDEALAKPLTIGEGSYVGWESCIGKGASLGPRTVVLPNTVLTWKATGPDAVLLGVPGRVWVRV